MKNEIVGYIYIITNPYFKDGICKIGYATDVEKRLQDFNRETGSIPSYEIYATFPTTKVVSDKAIHKLIDLINPEARIVGNREWYCFTKEQAFDIIQAIAGLNNIINTGSIYNLEHSQNIEKLVNKKISITNGTLLRESIYNKIAEYLNITFYYNDEQSKIDMLIKSDIPNLRYHFQLLNSKNAIRIGFVDTKNNYLNIDCSDMENNITDNPNVINKRFWYTLELDDLYNISDSELEQIKEIYNKLIRRVENESL